MNCFNHKIEAVGICVNCGKGLCKDCVNKTPSSRFVCSKECLEATVINEKIISLTLDKTRRGHSISSLIAFLMGIAFVAFGINDFIKHPDWPTGYFLGIFGIIMIIAGFVYRRAGRTIKNSAS